MENNKFSEEFSVEIVTNKLYFMEEAMNISFKCINKTFKPNYTDWIALYECSSIRNLEEFIAVETDLMMQSPTKYGFNHVKFLANQLKNIKCDKEYEFVYGNKFNEIHGISHPVHFTHKNECYCYDSKPEINHDNSCVSQEFINSLLARISILDNQLTDCKVQSIEILAMNKRLMAQMHENEEMVQQNNEFLDNLFYSNEPVTRDDGCWVEACTDIDLKISFIGTQESELQELSNQHFGLTKVLEKFTDKENYKIKTSRGTQSDESYLLIDLDSDIGLDRTVTVEGAPIQEPSTGGTIVFIDSDPDDDY